ncbi:MAG: ABC transporter substrate-binding protein [Pseudomonadota bacterium]|nr:ABC transporter substrate-binding protein [Pseudomonadota bacterium]
MRPTPLSTSPSRRQWLQQASWLTAGAATSGWAAESRPHSPRGLVVAQCVDFSQGQQDVSKDFLIGARAAWQDINLRGGVRGRRVEHLVLETDGTPASVRTALDAIKANPACVALSGSVGDQLASELLALSRKGELGMAHAAPWLQNASLEIDDNTFPIFAARQEQISHALKNLSGMGIRELGAVYASGHNHAAYHAEVERIAADLQLQLRSFQGAGELRALGQKLTPQTPAVLLFVGGTPELAEFSKGLEKQARQRYVVALADVNLQTLMQMGAARNTPVIATQPVPLMSARLPVVRHYRETLARLFEEAPTPLSLAGFIAARYTYEVLSEVEGPLTRQTALAAFQRRSGLDVGGFRISFNPRRRSSTYVTQSMMTPDGRLIG